MDMESENIRACRTCGIHYVTASKHQLKHLFLSSQDNTEIMLIRLELSKWNVEVAENDGFPQYICNTCIHKFEQVFEFRSACINTQNELRKFYSLPNGNIPIVKIKTELPEPDEVPPICDFIYVDELSDGEYDGATPFNFPHIPIKEEIIESAAIPMEESQQPTKSVDSSRAMQADESSLCIPEFAFKNETVPIPKNINEIKCTLCQFLCSNREEQKRHMLEVHELSDFECNICGKEFKNSTPSRFKFHIKFHNLNRQIKCSLCSFVCNSKIILRRHRRTKHRKFNCKICGKGILLGKLNTHLRQHQLDFKYSCEYCSEAFATEMERENHIWDIHANEDNKQSNPITSFHTNYTQILSEESFNVEQNGNFHHSLQEHMLFQFVCVHCENRFQHKIDLETHVNERHCGIGVTAKETRNSFTQETRTNESCEMSQYVKEHSDIAPFEEYDSGSKVDFLVNNLSTNTSQALQSSYSTCTASGFLNQTDNVMKVSGSISSSDEMSDDESKNEIKINFSSYLNTNLNSFACAKCTETFVTIEHLRQHHEQHVAAEQIQTSNTKPKFQCPFCKKYFDLKFSLNRHIKKHKYAPF